jgi:hypothetical protein
MRFSPLLLLVLVSAAAESRNRPPQERVVSGDGIVTVNLNGVTGRIRIDPAAPALPMFTTPFAAGRAQLRAGPFAFGYMVGPQQVPGLSAVGRIAIGEGARPRKRRVGWTGRTYVEGADGVIGPGGVPEPVVRFVLRPPIPGERTVTLPLEDEGGLFGGWGGSYALIDLDGRPLRIRFNPHEPRTLATAGAAVRIANAQEGVVSGEASPVHIAFGISRPVRTMRLAGRSRWGRSPSPSSASAPAISAIPRRSARKAATPTRSSSPATAAATAAGTGSRSAPTSSPAAHRSSSTKGGARSG